MFIVGMSVASGNTVKSSVHREVKFKYFWHMMHVFKKQKFSTDCFSAAPKTIRSHLNCGYNYWNNISSWIKQ